ncbi:hypothetical protein TTHERM_00411360 (macronuclear) [Tetrahymena thermophila SB210]|uniref:Uncharacterized protein n=1 Tax=Tetrahymena thermophila (strain SB210) TaxID=312017 RepID=I7LW17_TETTS|nr:hypothetical protein TTHERM_00411360 [Tetrahymena thermophila SB210]EAS00585.1 hypothetical protein TTHERM_00411360 [Tetrahymena thermophila SB210]|eukprot:XP_001020830.1 hypothetical protein TTHERM_00411360 [Tetrahymena thermophila SB210]
MEIEQDNIINSVIKLIKQSEIKEAIKYLLQIEQVNQNDLESFLDSQILIPIFSYYIQKDDILDKHDREDQIQQYYSLLSLIDRLILIDDQRINRIIMKCNIKELMSKLVAIKDPNFSVSVFSSLSQLAKQTPELFSTQFIYQLQRSLLEKCSNSSQRLEYFFYIFYNLKDQSPKYKIDAYFYTNFLKMQFQSIKLTKQSIKYVLSTLQHLLKEQENSESNTFKNIFEVVAGFMFPRLSLDYNICNANFEECDQNIQFEFFQLIKLFMIYCQNSATLFISKNISEIRNVITDIKIKNQSIANVCLVLELINEAISSQNEYSLLIIDNLLSWEKFQNVLDDLTFQNKKDQKDEFIIRKIKQVICDILVNMLNKSQEHIIDYFINEFLIGQLVDLSTYLDSKRRQTGIEALVKVLTYLMHQQPEKFIIDLNNQEKNQDKSDLDYLFPQYKSGKIILNSLADLFEMTQLPYDANKVIPSYYFEMQKLSNKVKNKLYKKFGDKLPKSLRGQVNQYNQSNNQKLKKVNIQENQDEWEDVSEDSQEAINNLHAIIVDQFNLQTKQSDESYEE